MDNLRYPASPFVVSWFQVNFIHINSWFINDWRRGIIEIEAFRPIECLNRLDNGSKVMVQ